MQVHYAKTRWTRDHRPGPTSSPSIPVLDQHFGVVDHSISSPTQQDSDGPGLARPNPQLLLSSGDENGVRPPWAAMSLTRASQGRVIKERLRNRPGEGEVCNTLP